MQLNVAQAVVNYINSLQDHQEVGWPCDAGRCLVANAVVHVQPELDGVSVYGRVLGWNEYGTEVFEQDVPSDVQKLIEWFDHEFVYPPFKAVFLKKLEEYDKAYKILDPLSPLHLLIYPDLSCDCPKCQEVLAHV